MLFGRAPAGRALLCNLFAPAYGGTKRIFASIPHANPGWIAMAEVNKPDGNGSSRPLPGLNEQRGYQ